MLAKKLHEFDHILIQIADFIREHTPLVIQPLADKLQDATDPMFDFEAEADMVFYLCEDDPDYSKDADNILTKREIELKLINEKVMQTLYDLDFRNFAPLILQDAPVSWWFHDLTEHDYSDTMPRLSLDDCLRVGRIHINIKTEQQFCYDINSAQFINFKDKK